MSNLNPGPASSVTDNTSALIAAVTQVFYPPSLTVKDISATALKASVNGGGIVKLPPGNLILTAPLPMYNGVIYEGTGWGFDQSQPTFAPSGTVLQGNGKFACFEYNGLDLHATPPSNQTVFLAGELIGGGLRALSMNNFTYGVHIGDYYNPGCQGSVFEDLCATNCGWGFWIENFDGIRVNRLFAFQCGTSTAFQGGGGGWFGNSSNTLWSGGDSDISYLFSQNASIKATGWVFNGRGGGGDTLNDLRVGFIAHSRATSAVTSQAATFANGSTSIATTSSTFVPGMPVFFSGSPSGFTDGKIYFVSQIIDSGHIAVAAQVVDTNQSFTNLTAGGPASATISTYGQPHIAVMGTGPSTKVNPMVMSAITFEGSSTCALLFQNTSGITGIGADCIMGVQGTNYQVTACYRTASAVSLLGFGGAGTPLYTDMDGGINTMFGPRPSGYSGVATGTAIGPAGLGVLNSDASGRLLINNMGLFLTNGPPDLANNKNGFLEFPNQPLGQAACTFTDGDTIKWWGWTTRTNHWVYTGGGGAGGTLQTIQANGEGVWLWLVNSTANSMVITSDGTQKIYNGDLAGSRTATTFTVAAGKHAILIASYNGAGTGTTTNYFFARFA